MFYILI